MAALPYAGWRDITGDAPFLILAPHPDDESLGCGGLLAQACACGADAHVAILTDGSGSHPHSRQYPPERLTALREAEAADAVSVLGLPPGRLTFLRYKDTAAPLEGPDLQAAASRLAEICRALRIATVFSSWEHDPHCDHLAAHRIAALAAGSAGARLLSYAVWGWTLPPAQHLETGPLSGARLDITANLPTKRCAIACHRSQMTGLITDDPAGFTLPQGLLDLCGRPFEAFIQA